ncbi:hypothetical protein TOT_010001015 [Theileria orientalis strain Shintoku]|uniref:Uncharacterized protein n=1 Tax=Theileria orientalis strain Shintoku TaxID=869250 RepID=J4D6G4_THEOR|nr:hypothetical protein TOT_010001015 [Theileria orientalis strain Shintoku]PVC49588.1 hypothetical protein MACL_00002878 [Theileria orientalis]BAM39560.1 hypothetical protein TOT_010001015 [Theileria orientalis strain Shintoku]|eukprot:XP_009689861.1 hypothetical protein TOT_010001015 [Theileria orientalis strain Shintoku]
MRKVGAKDLINHLNCIFLSARNQWIFILLMIKLVYKEFLSYLTESIYTVS